MKNSTLLRILKISSFLIFLGRAYQHLFWDAPFRSFFWDQHLLEPIVTSVFGVSWQSYVTNLNTDHAIQFLTRSTGVLYSLCAVISLTINEKSKRWMYSVLKLGSVSLILLALLLTKEKFYHLVMFFEHTIQFGVPVALIYFLKSKNQDILVLCLKMVIAFAFTCHGMYALGYFYPLPGNFVTMTLNILPIQEEMAKNMLFLAGILDFVIAIAIFIPRITKIALLYAAFWGFATALARILSGFHYDVSLSIIHQYLYLVIYRLPHGIIPLLVYFLIRQPIKSTRITNLVSV
ncbi:hypothetical protein SAMN04489761_2767 [Tenacibaculum sp. MAR_2009_124]|uniref:hypothetical protein n=1 Tax=Tenacibaculum sp. MAR_2009_124 TaxID=1250059 RepID=UPI00089BC504|nr:hypothetical protein [Tenacibaculum sp. MAR_2009_124]SEC35748.1 hypothetical protein SAMN04489761_2767 [Tenacibaculum sp. MAR_2009_124]